MNKVEWRRFLRMLDRYRYCDDRASAADHRAMRHPGTVTMDREFALAARWQAKADAAWDEAIAFINADAGEQVDHVRQLHALGYARPDRALRRRNGEPQ